MGLPGGVRTEVMNQNTHCSPVLTPFPPRGVPRTQAPAPLASVCGLVSRCGSHPRGWGERMASAMPAWRDSAVLSLPFLHACHRLRVHLPSGLRSSAFPPPVLKHLHRCVPGHG